MTVGKPKLTRVDINGIDVSQYVLGWAFDPEIAKTVKSLDIALHKNVYSAVSQLQTQPRALSIVVRRGVLTATESYVFRGEIISRETIGNQVVVKANDKLYQAVRKNITRTFDSNVDTEAGKISEIFKTLVELAGLTADNTTVQDSGTTFILRVFICNNADIFERLELLAEFLSWQFYYNAGDDKVYFEPKGSRSGTNTLIVGSNVVNRPKWVRDGTKVVEEVKVLGGPVESETQESFNGNGSTKNFALANSPVSVKITVDGVLKVGGVEDQSPNADYFVNAALKKITFVTAPPTGSGNVVADYSYLSPIALRGDNPTVTEGQQVTLRREELKTVPDVQNFVGKYLQRHQNDFLATELQVTNITDLEVGQTVTVQDTNEGINQNFIVTKIHKAFPYRYDVIKVDTEPIQIEEWEITVEDRLRRIEEKLSQEETLVIIIKSFDRTNAIKIGRRWFKIERANIAGDTLIWGNETFGLWNDFKWGAAATTGFILGNFKAGILGTSTLGSQLSTPMLRFVQQGGNVYTEAFKDTDFKDTTGTATWNTTTKKLEFTAAQIGQSKEIDYRNGTITKAKLTVTIDSGTFTLYLSADGGTNWESVTSGSIHTFTNTGTNLKWKITESGASTGEISQVVVDNYH